MFDRLSPLVARRLADSADVRAGRTLALSLVAAVVVSTVQFGPDLAASELRRSAIVVAVEKARPSVVNIHGQKTVPASYDDQAQGDATRRVNGMGTGVIIDPRGYILTNHHVVQGVRRIQVTLLDGATHYGRLISFDPKTDLALIKIDVPDHLPVLPIGTSSDLMTGETVIAVGNAYGYEHTVTRGIISALHRTVQVSDTQQYEDLIQTDASINPGNSGGPLLNIDGEMIGINVAVRAGAQGIGFAIPVDRALDVAADLISVRRIDNHWHGIVPRSDARKHDGLAVARVEKDSPADKSGLASGDVITAAAGEVVHDRLEFERALLGRKEGEKVDLAVERDQKPVKVSLTLAAAPGRTPVSDDQAWTTLGLKLGEMSAPQFRSLNSRYRGGLLVADVRDGSPAQLQGIRAGDVLVGMHIWETISLDNVAYVLGRPDFRDLMPLKFYILRGNETLFGHFSLAETDLQRK